MKLTVSLLLLLPLMAFGAVSPDGSQLKPTDSGSLSTVDGSWTFSQASAQSGWVLLNGLDTRGRGQLLQVDSGGKMYQLSLANVWWVWSGGAPTSGWWSQTTAPPTPEPTPPNPTPPNPPDSIGAGQAALYWQPVPGADHYNVLIGTQPGHYNPPVSVKQTTYELITQPPGLYFVAVQAVAADGTSGNLSAEVAFNILAPTLNCHVPVVTQNGLTVNQQLTCDVLWPNAGGYKYYLCGQMADATGQASCMDPAPIGIGNGASPAVAVKRSPRRGTPVNPQGYNKVTTP
jgi:hypothetical protein